jgi:hypothetical protein
MVREPISEGVRVLLLDEVQQILERLRNMTTWLQAPCPSLERNTNVFHSGSPVCGSVTWKTRSRLSSDGVSPTK